VEEFDTSNPVVPGLAEDYFAAIVSEFLASGQGEQGLIGSAPSVLVDAAPICAFAVDWLERNAVS
jgi:aminoglycoside 3-N-acetyltransferase